MISLDGIFERMKIRIFMEINGRIEKIIEDFGRFNDWEDRYRHLIEMGKQLNEMPSELKREDNKIKGCQSSVWLSANYSEGKIVFSADSDASIVKGLISLLVYIYSQSTPDEILQTKPFFIEKIGLSEHLSMSRAQGLTAMIKQMMFYAMAFKAQEGK